MTLRGLTGDEAGSAIRVRSGTLDRVGASSRCEPHWLRSQMDAHSLGSPPGPRPGVGLVGNDPLPEKQPTRSPLRGPLPPAKKDSSPLCTRCLFPRT